MAQDYLDEDEGALEVGRKVIEMADRAKAVHAAVPGAQAAWAFEIDDTRYRVVVTVVDVVPE